MAAPINPKNVEQIYVHIQSSYFIGYTITALLFKKLLRL